MLDFITYDEKTQTLTFLPNEAVREVLVKDKAFTITYKDGKQDILKFKTTDATTNKTVPLTFSGITFDPNKVRNISVKDKAYYELTIYSDLFNYIYVYNSPIPFTQYYIGEETNLTIIDKDPPTINIPYSRVQHLAKGATLTYTCHKTDTVPLIKTITSHFGYCLEHKDNLKIDSILEAIEEYLTHTYCSPRNYFCNLDLSPMYTNNHLSCIDKVKKAFHNTPSMAQIIQSLREYEFMNIPLVSLNVTNFNTQNQSITVKITREAPDNLFFTNLHEFQQEPFYPFIASILNSYQNIHSRSNLKNEFEKYSTRFINLNFKEKFGDYISKSAALIQMGGKDYKSLSQDNASLLSLNLGLYVVTNEFHIQDIRDTHYLSFNTLPPFQLEVTLPLLADGTCPITVEAPDTLPKETFMVSENKLIINPKTTFFIIEKTFTHDSEFTAFSSEHAAYTLTCKGKTLRGTYHDTDAILSAITLKIKQPLTEVTSKLSITTTLTIPGHPVQTKQHTLGQVFKR